MTTARTLIGDALQDIGVVDPNETMSAEQADHGLRTLNRIVDAWRAARLYVYTITDVSASFSGASATVGSGLTVNTAAPVRFEPGCYYVKSGDSYPLPEMTYAQYAAVQNKSESGDYPQGYYYDKAIPGRVYVWPVPAVSTEYHFQVRAKISAFANLDTDYSLPDGYQDALHYSLCERLPGAYNLPISQADAVNAVRARSAIRKNNVFIPVLSVGDGQRTNIISG